MADKPSYKAAHDARKHGEASMTIEAMPEAPKSFTDKNTDTRYLPQDIPVKGGSVSPNPNADANTAKDHVRDISVT